VSAADDRLRNASPAAPSQSLRDHPPFASLDMGGSCSGGPCLGTRWSDGPWQVQPRLPPCGTDDPGHVARGPRRSVTRSRDRVGRGRRLHNGHSRQRSGNEGAAHPRCPYRRESCRGTDRGGRTNPVRSGLLGASR
jgi:hypothetical protein